MPFPQVLTINFNWSSLDISCADLLKIYISFADSISLKDLFYVSSEAERQNKLFDYDLVSFTVFVGAHYMILVSEKDHRGRKTTMWKLYNDTDVRIFMDWAEVVAFCLNSKCIPTLLFYEVAYPVFKNTQSQSQDINRFLISAEQLDVL